MPSEEPGDLARGYFLATIHLAQLRAHIQHEMLTHRTASLHGTTVQTLAIGHLEELQQLQSSLGIDTCPFSVCLTTDPSQLSITYTALVTRLMINETFFATVNSSAILSDAQSAIGILVSMGRGDNLGNYAILPRYSAVTLPGTSPRY